MSAFFWAAVPSPRLSHQGCVGGCQSRQVGRSLFFWRQVLLQEVLLQEAVFLQVIGGISGCLPFHSEGEASGKLPRPLPEREVERPQEISPFSPPAHDPYGRAPYGPLTEPPAVSCGPPFPAASHGFRPSCGRQTQTSFPILAARPGLQSPSAVHGGGVFPPSRHLLPLLSRVPTSAPHPRGRTTSSSTKKWSLCCRRVP